MVWDTYCCHPHFNAELNIGEYLKDNVHPLPEENEKFHPALILKDSQ